MLADSVGVQSHLGLVGFAKVLDVLGQPTPTIPLTLTSHSPVTNTVAAPLTSSVVLTYSADIDSATVTSRTVAVHSMMQGLITGTHSVVDNGVTVGPATNFFPGELVYAIATTHTADITGTSTITPTVWQFNAAAGVGPGTFPITHTVTTAALGAISVEAADVDGDGDLDFLSASQSDNKIAWYENTSPPSSDATISVTVSPASAKPGDSITYTLTFSNTGGADATGVVITDSVPVSVTNPSVADRSGAVITPTGTTPNFVWQVADLAPGAGGVITLTGTLTEPLAAGVFVVNSTTITATGDGDSGNNGDSATLLVLNAPPTAVDDTALVMRNDSGELTLLSTAPVTIPVLVNDTDPNSGNNIGLTVTAVGTPSQGGSAAVNSTGKLVDYTPTAFTGTETFTYTVSDGFLTDTATVTVTVINGDGGGSIDPGDSDGETIVIPGTGISQTITVTVHIPAGVATDTFALVYDEVETPSGAAPEGFVAAGLSFTLDAYLNQQLLPGYVFSTPITLTIEYSDEDVADLPGGEGSLTLRRWDDSQWSSSGITLANRAPESNQMTVIVDRGGEYALLGQDVTLYYLPIIAK